MADQAALLPLPVLTASLSGEPALNFGALGVLIWVVSPIFGLRPERAARWATEKLPKPVSRTSSPRIKLSVIVVNTASTALGPRLAHIADAGDGIDNFGSGAHDVFLFQNSLYRLYIRTNRPRSLCAVSYGIITVEPAE